MIEIYKKWVNILDIPDRILENIDSLIVYESLDTRNWNLSLITIGKACNGVDERKFFGGSLLSNAVYKQNEIFGWRSYPKLHQQSL
ncbi:hypothetical protein DRO97_08500 [Archaeoglobales archaeon]|nr:MAG: hypothetical protein DRO97_08500 [Archaeoglobales archaeon]